MAGFLCSDEVSDFYAVKRYPVTIMSKPSKKERPLLCNADMSRLGPGKRKFVVSRKGDSEMSERVERAFAVNSIAVCSDGERAEERVSIELDCRTVFVGQHASELHQYSCPFSTSICSSICEIPIKWSPTRKLHNCPIPYSLFPSP